MQALPALTHFWLAAVLHLQPVAECACLASLGAPAQCGGALVVGITKVPPLLPGSPNSMHHGAAVAGCGGPGLERAAGGACRPSWGWL